MGSEGFSVQSPFRILPGLLAPQRQHSRAALLQNFTGSATFKVAPSPDFPIPPPMPIPSGTRTALIQCGTGSVLGLVGGVGAILAQGFAQARR